METATIRCKLPLEGIPGLFREAIEGRPLKAKMNRVRVYTPDVGPYLGAGGIVDPGYVIAVDVEPVNAANSQAGGSIIMLAERDGSGSRVAVVTDRWSRLSFSTGLKAIRDGLITRLKSASAPRQDHRVQESSPVESGSIREVSVNALRVAEFLMSTDESDFTDMSTSCDLTLREVSEAIKELSAARVVERRQGGVYRFIGEIEAAAEDVAPKDSDLSQGSVDGSTDGGVGEPASGGLGVPISAAERVEKLESAANLLDRGLITPDDFDQLRRELLE